MRLKASRASNPTTAILDSRTLRSSSESGHRAGYVDGAKRKKGSKVHAAVDTLGYLLALHVSAADEQDRFQIREVSADKAYLSRKNLKAVERVGGVPYVPFKTNTQPPNEDSIWAKMYSVFMLNRETFLEHYHKRSSVESAFSMVKAKFGDSLRSKSDTGQINEVLCKILCHNLSVLCYAMHRLAMEPTPCP